MSDKKQQQAEALKIILQQLSEGASVEDVREEFQKTFDTVDANEIAAAEAELIKTGTPIEDILQLCNVHASVVEGSVEVIAVDPVMGHPLTVFYKENDGLEEFLDGAYAEAKAAFLSSNDNRAYANILSAWHRKPGTVSLCYSAIFCIDCRISVDLPTFPSANYS
ncbi:MAG TPA: DUF438 domain-containing protein, partial [Oscillospiraceae bacterium]|nr:DUF438 domain-containing protein [Oscillospiraceae bacterium]